MPFRPIGWRQFLYRGSLFSVGLQLMSRWQKLTSKRWQSPFPAHCQSGPLLGEYTRLRLTAWFHGRLQFHRVLLLGCIYLYSLNAFTSCRAEINWGIMEGINFLHSPKTCGLYLLMLIMLGSAPRIQNLKRWEIPKTSLQGINYYFPCYEDDSKPNGKGVAAYLNLKFWNC